ncbi:alpha/beta fold hydrolase [Streptomyces sp. NPDC048045]|uniref:thioesterase domain-containing protein n=1 Tax=Streptomyces sp. NPDC048045 TaxID=3154710 RepID=UPI00342D7A65
MLPADRSVFGVEAWGLHSRPPQEDFAAMAEEYAATVAASCDAPPVIIGWCFGGVMAFATAQALRRAGHEVVQLIIVNCAVPGDEEGPPRRSPPTTSSAASPSTTSWTCRRGSSDTGNCSRPCRTSGGCPPDSGEAELRSLLDVYTANMTVMDRYFMQERTKLDRPDFPVLLVRAEPDDEPLDPDRTCGWGSVVGPDLGFASVAANHHGIVRQPAVARLAELIGRELDA